MKVKISDYVTEEEIKGAILEGVKEKVYDIPHVYFGRVMVNALSGTARALADEIFAERGYHEDMNEKVKEVLNGLASCDVFIDSNRQGKKKSGGQNLLDKTVSENKQLLEKRAKSVFDEEYSAYVANLDIAQIMSEHVYELFSTKKENEK